MRDPNTGSIYTITQALNASLETSKQAIRDSAKCAAISIFASRVLDACEVYEEALKSFKCECVTQPKESFHDPACYCENDYICMRYVYKTCVLCQNTGLNPIALEALNAAKNL